MLFKVFFRNFVHRDDGNFIHTEYFYGSKLSFMEPMLRKELWNGDN